MVAGTFGLALLAVPLQAAAAPARPTPLTVTLTQITPSTIPSRGRLVLAGTVTNSSSQRWTSINVLPLTSSTPMTSRGELAAAARTDPAVEVGPRLTAPGTFDSIGDLAPGQTKSFRISLRRSALQISGAPGVYWLGVHALGTNRDGSDALADGRARTFIPLVTGHSHTSVAVVVPLRARVSRGADGRLLDLRRWATLLAPDGRLDRVANFAASAGAIPVTWLVDPAVLDAATALAQNNPTFSLGGAHTASTAGPGSPGSPGGSPSGSTPSSAAAPSSLWYGGTAAVTPSQTGSSSSTGSPVSPVSPTTGSGPIRPPVPSVPPVPKAQRANAEDWLRRVTEGLTGHPVLGLGYADPDIAALARRDPSLLAKAAALATTRFDSYGIPVTSAVAPVYGWLDQAALPRLGKSALVLASDHGHPHPRTRWHSAGGQELVLSDGLAESGGPAPGSQLTALALRQRIVSDAALRALAGIHSTMVVVLPPRWDPGPSWRSADFFAQLNTSWLQLATLTRDARSRPVLPIALAYDATQRKAELGTLNLQTTRSLIATGQLYRQLLTNANDTAAEMTGTALTASSYFAREDRLASRTQVLAASTAMTRVLDAVKVIGSDFVTMSGSSGSLTVTLVNDLGVPVAVGVHPQVGSTAVHVDASTPVRIGPHQRTTLRLRASATGIGVHQVALVPITRGGRELGTPLYFSVRSSQVGTLIWVILVAGATLLAVMIVRRLVARVRDSRAGREG